jgi:transposase
MLHGALPGVSVARIYLYANAVDMRRSFNGLHAIVQAEFDRDIRSGDLFVFLNKRQDRMKAIWWDVDGLAIFMKRLESGTYQRPTASDDGQHLLIDRTQLALLLSGIELSSVRRRKRYSSRIAS